MSANEPASSHFDGQQYQNLLDFDAISHQVQCDVNFLENRLKMMRAQHTPNQPVIRTYEDMLRNRLNVLNRLKDEHQIDQRAG